MTSFANQMQIFLWQIATVIPIKGTRTSIDMPGFQTKSLTITIVCGNDSRIAWEDSRIITTNNRYGQRLCLEAWHINASSCVLSRDDGSYLPQI